MSSRPGSPGASAGFPLGGGAMGEQIRCHDWSRTPLGPIKNWSQSLRTTVSLVLETRFPTILGWGPELTVLYNDAYRPLLGRKPEALGRPFLEVWSEAYATIHPLVEQVWAGESVYFENAEFILMRHGQPQPACFDFCFSPLRDETGTVRGLLNTAVETTERHRVSQALRVSEERYRLLVEGMTEYAMLMLDPEGRITVWNSGAEHLFGYRAEEVIGQTAELIFTPEDRALGIARQELATAITTGQANDERWHLRRDGSRFWASGVITALYHPDERLRGLAKVLRDNTERRQAEEALREREDRLRVQARQLEQINERKTEFLGILGHELRTPLAALHNALTLLDMEGLAPADRQEAMGILHRQDRHLRRLVDDLLNVVRIDQGRIDLRPVNLNLADAVANALELVRDDIKVRGHHLEVDLPDQDLYLRADPERLTQMLSNLLSNAARYTGDGGRIDLSAWREGEEAFIRVRDNGIGIAPEQLPRLFETFTRLEPGRQHYSQGLGLGLALVDKLVKLHGGHLEAASAGTGRGSTFTLRLPALPKHGRIATEQQPPRQKEAVILPRRRILLIEDEADVAQALMMLLRTLGQEVQALHQGTGATQAVRQWQPEVVLIDLGLPDIDGYEVARQLRQTFGQVGPRLIALTGYGLEENRQRAWAAGFDHYLTKPVELEALQAVLREG